MDWVRDGLRVQVKHAQMLFQRGNHWCCIFSRIKCAMNDARQRDLLDELRLLVYSPFGLHFFKHAGGTIGYSEAGLRTGTHGHNILFSLQGWSMSRQLWKQSCRRFFGQRIPFRGQVGQIAAC